MKCPVCKTTRLEPGELESGLPARRCGTCGGQFLRLERYLAWLRRHPADSPDGGGAMAAGPPVADSGPGKLCPACGAFLIRHEVGDGLAFHVDRCGRCGGFWLDAGEWASLRRRGLHRRVHHVCSTSWQRHVKRQRRRRQYRRVVTRVLDGRLRRQVGEADVGRLKALKQWLDTHPARAALYTYLATARDL